MRLVQVAKILGMTGQDLRKELTLVDFGVKPTDREMTDALAHGVIRFLARKHNLKIDLDAIMAGNFSMDETGGEGAAEPEEAAAAAPASEVKPESLHVLRKLTLDDVSKEAIQRQVNTMPQQSHAPSAPRRSAPAPRPVQATSGVQQQIKKKEGIVMLPSQITVKEFAEKSGVQVPQVISALMKSGVLATVNQNIDYDTAAIIAGELGVTVAKEQSTAKIEDILAKNLEDLLKDEPENLKPRPPVVVVMGHVDHGKTSILDAIRQTNVVAGESGGITQHIGAYQVEYEGKKVTFLDTPGHQAFAAMRARGAQITDIAILVVSAEEGVKETTIEAINHVKEAGVPVIVAINKMDRPNADPERVKGELAGYGLQPEEWGGPVPFVPCSALTKQGIDTLISTVLLVAEIEDLKANPNRTAVGTVIESHLDSSLGALGTVIVSAGTLKVGDAFICGRTSGKVRAMNDASGTRLQEVGPSGAVRISGFSAVPQVGDIFQAVGSEREARDLHEAVMENAANTVKRSFADLVSRLTEGKLKQLKVVLKADAQGSLEAIQMSLEKQATTEVQVKVIHGAIGAVSESDVMMASASEALVLAFRVPVPAAVARTAEREGVKVKQYDVIYLLLEEIALLLTGLLIPEEQEKVLGHIEVKGVFLTKKNEQIIGGRVTDGVIKRVAFRLKRGEEQVGTGRITSLRKVDNDIKEAKEGSECGMRVDCTVPVLVGDVMEAYVQEFKKKED